MHTLTLQRHYEVAVIQRVASHNRELEVELEVCRSTDIKSACMMGKGDTQQSSHEGTSMLLA